MREIWNNLKPKINIYYLFTLRLKVGLKGNVRNGFTYILFKNPYHRTYIYSYGEN